MSGELPSSNPFRRKAPAVSFVNNDTPASLSTSQLPPIETAPIEPPPPATTRTKPVKKVRVQSPPPSSPESQAYPEKPPAPRPRFDEVPQVKGDPFDKETESSDDSDPETRFPKLSGSGAPLNPFSKTLATLERTDGESGAEAHEAPKAVPNAGRASMNVDAFKRMLMTGNSGVGSQAATTAPSSVPGHVSFGINDGGSSTDTSSISRHSVFEAIQDAQPESPRTSHEVSDPDEERRRLRSESNSSASDRKKPPPPSHRHGKLIKVELKNENDSNLLTRLTTPPERSPVDVHKPLPAAPLRSSHESDRESIFDKESLGKTPEPPSPTQSANANANANTRKGPPPPPTRRHSQLVAESKLNPVSGRLSPNLEEDDSTSSTRQSVASPPPPPPTRRPASLRNSSYGAIPGSPGPGTFIEPEKSTSTTQKLAPVPPPSRSTSLRQSGRPPSISSVDLSSSGRRSGATPPPPPPPRQRASSRNSMDLPGGVVSPGSGRTSGEYMRRSFDSNRRPSMDNARRGSAMSGLSMTVKEEDQKINETATNKTASQEVDSIHSRNALLDLEALQKEIDDFRLQSEKRNVT